MPGVAGIEAKKEGLGEEVATTETLEFAVRVDRSSGAPLGIDIESGRDSLGWDGRTLLVKQVHEAGLFGAWAAANPAAAVLAGDRIVAVNGRRGDAAELIEECKRHQLLEIRVARELLFPDCAPADAVAAAKPRARRIPDDTLAAIRKEIADARSASACVQVVRRQLERNWDFVWGAEALACIAKRSTSQTRKGWSEDATVLALAQRLRSEATADLARSSTESVLLALEAMRRMGLQGPEQQREVLLAVAASLASEASRLPVSSLARLLWLAVPLRLDGLGPAWVEVRRRFLELAGPDVAALASAMRRAAVASLLRGPRELKQGTVVCNGFQAASELSLSFDLLPRAAVPEWASVLRFGLVGDEEGAKVSDPSPLPALYLQPNTTRLLATLGPPESAPEECLAAEDLPPGQMSRVTMRLSGKTCTVLVNGTKVCSVPGCDAPLLASKQGERLRIWGGGPEHAPASGTIGNVTYRPMPHCPGRDAELLDRILRRLRTEGLLSDLSASELSELAENLAELGAPADAAALRAFGQEVLQRRPELTLEELWRVRVSFALCGMPLNKVWAAVGTSAKHSGGKILTKQAFATQRGHEKRQKTEHEAERASPPRQFADRVRSSF